jgi:uncharacterized metal-binding protein
VSDAPSGVVGKVGVISCSGEEIAEGTISRLATRHFARTHPMITIDGCDKQCAKWAAEKYGERPVRRALVVSDILGEEGAACRRSLRDQGEADREATRVVAEKIATEVDSVLAEER